MITWLADSPPALGQLGATVQANIWGYRGNCFAACELACQVAGYDVPIYRSVCAGKCYDDSDCASLKYGSEEEYDYAVAQLEAKLGELAYNEAQKKKQQPAPSTTEPVKYPWKQFAPETKVLQTSLNAKLVKDGLCQLTVDGRLGSGTCGAAQRYGTAPATCLVSSAPKVCAVGAGSSEPPASHPAVAKSAASSAMSSNSGLIAGLVIIGVAAAIFLGTLNVGGSR